MNKTKHGTKIEWTHWPGYKGETWNVVSGCSHAGTSGCDNCYAKRLFPRVYGNDEIKLASTMPPDFSDTSTPATHRKRRFSDIKLHYDRLRQPLSWAKPRAVFACSMGDLFHPDVPFVFIDKVFLTMVSSSTSIIGCPYGHIFLVLTKRPERMLEYYQRPEHKAESHNFHKLMQEPGSPGIWLGTTVENQDSIWRVEELLKVPSSYRFVSCEPLLSGIKLKNCLPAKVGHSQFHREAEISWVLCGAESGPGARPMELEWARDLRDQCQAAGTPFFMKQLCDDKGRKIPMDEWPDDLRVQEFPEIG